VTQPIITDSMRAYARVLLSKSDRWARGVDHQRGVAFVMFASSRTDREGRPMYHRTGRDGSICTCPGFLHRGICSHALAVRTEAEEARERAATRRPRYEDLWIGEGDSLTDAF
jgi:hypothetical protein